MADYRFSIHVDAPPERVFKLWTDLDRMREWVGGVTRVTDVTGPVAQAGTRYTVWFGPLRSPTEVLEVESPGRIRTRFGNWLLRGETLATFDDEGGGTRLVQVFRTQGSSQRSPLASSPSAHREEASAVSSRRLAQ